MEQTVATVEPRRKPIKEYIPSTLEELADELDLRKGLNKRGRKLLRKYNLTALVDISEFERSLLRQIHLKLPYLSDIKGDIKCLVFYTFNRMLCKSPDLREALEKAEAERGSKCGAREALQYHVCQQLYERMKKRDKYPTPK